MTYFAPADLFYLSLCGEVVSVSVCDTGSALEFGAPTTLVQANTLHAIYQSSAYDDWDVTPDGQRCLVKQPAVRDQPTRARGGGPRQPLGSRREHGLRECLPSG